MKIRREAAGFSLVELTIAIGLIALLLSAGFVAMSEALARWRLNTATTDLSYTVLAARTKASMTRSEVAITFDSIDGKYMLTSLAGGGGSLDRLNNRIHELPTGVRFVSPDGKRAIGVRPPASFDEAAVFSSTGLLRAANTPGFLYVGDTRRGLYRRLEVNLVGKVSIQEWTGHRWMTR